MSLITFPAWHLCGLHGKKTTTDERLRRQQRSMYRQIGFRCLGSECNAFIVWKEIGPGQSAPTVRALKRASGTCPACGIRYQFSAKKLMEFQSEKPRSVRSQ